ncbi:MAG: alpha/beta hydrolase [Steroidobacteraceae bacterium]
MRTRPLMGMLLALCALVSIGTRAQAQTRWIEANGVSLRYELTGQGGHTIVLLHEMGMTLESWDLILPQLAASHRVLRYDLRGFGLSEKIRGVITFEDEVADLRALLDKLGISGKVTLVGGAVGAAVALDFAATYPERVEGVFAMSPAAGTDGYARSVGSMTAAARAERSAMRPLLDADMPDIYPDSIAGGAERRARFRAMQLSTDTTSMAATLRMIAITDFSGIFARIRCPTVIAAAALYQARPVAQMQAMADQIKGARLEVLQTGHFMASQSPELLLPVLQKFFTQIGI